MAHNLNFNEQKGTYSYFGVQKPAWHKLGQTVESALTSKEALKMANLDFEVDKKPCHIEVNDRRVVNFDRSIWKQVPGSFATYRTDNNQPLGQVGNKYEIIQNHQAFKFFDDIVGSKEAMFETAGALGLGETIFITAKLPKFIKVGGKDIIDRYLLFTNSHDGSRSIEVLFTPVRVVCNNTLQFALSTANNKVRIRHTLSLHDRLDEAKTVLQIENMRATEAELLYNEMSKIKMTDDNIRSFVNIVFLTSEEIARIESGEKAGDVLSSKKINLINDVNKYYYDGPGQKYDVAKGTLWGAYNSVSGYFQNAKIYKDSETKMKNVFYGSVYNHTMNAYNLASQIVKQPSMLV